MRRLQKPTIFVLALLPGLWLAYRAYNELLGVNPLEELELTTGIWALRFLLLSLAITPLERVGVIVVTLVMFVGVWLSPEVVGSRHDTAEQLLQAAQLVPQRSEGGEVAVILDAYPAFVGAAEAGK